MRSALGVAVLGLALMPTAVATAQPTTSGDAEQTIARLQSEGYDVIIDRIGTADMSQCEVASIRHPQTLTQTIVTGHNNSHHNLDIVTVVVSKSIHVTLDCST